MSWRTASGKARGGWNRLLCRSGRPPQVAGPFLPGETTALDALRDLLPAGTPPQTADQVMDAAIVMNVAASSSGEEGFRSVALPGADTRARRLPPSQVRCGPIPSKGFKKERKAIPKRIRDLDGVDPGDVDFRTEWLSVYGSYKLADRLRMIADQELGEGLCERIRTAPSPSLRASAAWSPSQRTCGR